jgi:hypothetical protein
MSLSHLPVEIVLLITKCLGGKSKTLASLAACSKLLRDIVTPVLYSDIKVNANTVKMETVNPWRPGSIQVS